VAARFHIAPTDSVLTVGVSGGQREARMLRWGLVPIWAKDLSTGSRMINARSATVGEKPASATPWPNGAAWAGRRLLRVAQERRRRQDAAVDAPCRPRAVRRCRAVGAWKQPDGEWLRSCTILTAGPNELMAPIHDRMPVILPREMLTHSGSGEGEADVVLAGLARAVHRRCDGRHAGAAAGEQHHE
jgi:putative SOS response-associated peptidase YedK